MVARIRRACLCISVEDRPIFFGAIQLLRKALGKVAVSEAGDAPEVLRLVRSQFLDMAILNMSLPDRSGSELLLECKRAVTNLRILVVGSFAEEQYAVRIFQSGGNGYLRKNADPGEVVRAVKKF